MEEKNYRGEIFLSSSCFLTKTLFHLDFHDIWFRNNVRCIEISFNETTILQVSFRISFHSTELIRKFLFLSPPRFTSLFTFRKVVGTTRVPISNLYIVCCTISSKIHWHIADAAMPNYHRGKLWQHTVMHWSANCTSCICTAVCAYYTFADKLIAGKIMRIDRKWNWGISFTLCCRFTHDINSSNCSDVT